MARQMMRGEHEFIVNIPVENTVCGVYTHRLYSQNSAHPFNGSLPRHKPTCLRLNRNGCRPQKPYARALYGVLNLSQARFNLAIISTPHGKTLVSKQKTKRIKGQK